jgi:hypothetical protein
VDRLGELDLPESLRLEIAPIFAFMESLRDQVRACNARAEERTKEDDAVHHLCTAPGIAP